MIYKFERCLNFMVKGFSKNVSLGFCVVVGVVLRTNHLVYGISH